MKGKQIEEYLTAISESNRLAILELLKNKELCACEIHPALGIPQNLGSHHLKVLKDVKLLTARKNGKRVYYQRDEKAITEAQKKLSTAINNSSWKK
jgi:ArsR family transcriptional regulator